MNEENLEKHSKVDEEYFNSHNINQENLKNYSIEDEEYLENCYNMHKECMGSTSSDESDWEEYEKKWYNKESEFTNNKDEDESSDDGTSPEEKLNSRLMKLADSDFADLHGMRDLGFRFTEKNCPGKIREIFPALDVHFAVKRENMEYRIRASSSSSSTPLSSPGNKSSSSSDRPEETEETNVTTPKTVQFFNPGDSPELMKIKLKNWAQSVVLSALKRC
ncbi:hypothetical protein LUZ60_006573 [Juncus effusus]|nr:hypothetical protein LUZ60_006573 [Juncus effusus]